MTANQIVDNGQSLDVAPSLVSENEIIEKQNTGDGNAMERKVTSVAELERALTGVAAEDFKPGKRLYVAFLTLAVITLMVALDGTSLSVALPVSLPRNIPSTPLEAD